MRNPLVAFVAAGLLALLSPVRAEIAPKVVEIPTRPGITQRMLVISPPEPKAAVVLFPGGHGGLQLSSNGSFKWGEGNFLVRSRQLFADEGLLVAVLDAPSDRQGSPFLQGFRQTPEHVADIKAVVAWMREQSKMPVWLVGTSRGTQSVANAAVELAGSDAPDGVILTSTILRDDSGRPVTKMPLGKIRIPVLVAHHEEDGCAHCPFADIPQVMDKLRNTPRKELLTFKGGENKGDPCEAMAYHGFNGLERDVVHQIAGWIVAK